jgi:hypothetical protein
MVRSIDPQREILRHAQWPFSPRSLSCLELVLRKAVLANVHMPAHLQVEHMEASDLIVANLQKDLASTGSSAYGRAKVSEIGWFGRAPYTRPVAGSCLTAVARSEVGAVSGSGFRAPRP